MTVTQGRAPVTPPRPARRAGDIVRGLCSLAALVVITGGMPAVFWFAGTILLPHGLPAPGDIGAVLTEPDDGTAFVAAALAAGWLAWAAFTLALLLEIPARLRGVSAPRLPGLRWGQQLAGGLVTGVLLLVPAGTALAQSPAAAPAITGSPATAATAPVAPEAPATVAPADVTPAEANPAPPAPVHTVRRGDSLWSIAEDRLGDPKRWPEIARLNDGRAMTDGQTFSAADHIMPGWVLILPAGARAGDPAGPAPAPAPQAPVAPQAAPAPAPDPASPDPASPDPATPETGAGTTRVTPPQTAPAGEEGTGNGTATVVVREGDTLSAIAARTLGDADRWPEIFRASTGRDQPGGARLTDPDELEIGWTLVIPAGPRTGGQPDPAPAQPAPPPGPPATQPPAPRAPEGQAPEAQSPEAQSPETRTPAPPTREPATPATGVPEPAAPSPGESVAPPAPEQPAQPPGEQGPAAAPGRDGGQAGPTAPDAAAPAPEPHGTQAAPGTGVMGAAPGASAPVSAPARAPEEPTASADDERDGIPAGVFGLAAVGAAALLGAIALRRRAQHAGRRLGRRIAMPGEDDAAAEAGLRAGEDPDALDLFDRTMRTLCARLRKENKRLPALDGGLLTPDRLSLELAAPARPPAPFVAPDGDEMRWECPAGAAILDAAAAARVPAPYPALVVLGERTDGAQVLADLESLGVVALTDGTHEDDVAVLRALAVELLANRWSEDVRITTVGFGHSLRAVARRGHGHLRRAGSLDEAFDQLASWTDEVVGLLAEAGLTSPRQARTHGVLPDTWAPEIILSAEPLAEHHIGHLRRLTTSHPRAAAAVVAPAGPEPWLSGLGVTRLPSAPGVVIPTRPRVSLVVQRLEDPQYASVVGMFRTADETDGAPAAPYETEPAYASAEFAASAPEPPVSGAGDAGPARAHAGDVHDGDVHDGGPGSGAPHGDPGDDPAGYGDPAHPGTEFAPGAGYADPANAAPAYHADPQHADSEYGDPAYRPAPGYADPGYADPGYRDPRSGESASGDGPEGDPGYGDPAYPDPGHVLSGTSGAGAPAGGTPAGGTFGSVAPGIGAPGIGAPGIGASGSGAPHVVENEPGLPGAPAPGTGVVPAPRRAVLAPLYGGHAGGPAHPGAVVAPVAAYLTAVHEPAPATADDDTDPDTPLPYGGGVTFPDVRLLGPVELAGAGEDTGAANSARLVEIAAWIALHPGGAVTDLDAAVWPLGVSETTRNSHLARLRRGLGTGTDGRHHLPPAAGGRLSLGPGVGCDWFRFRELTACHPRQGPWAVEAYTSALALVRGEPVSGTLPRRFVWAEPWRHTMTAAVVDTAVRLGGHRFHEGELDAARAAIDVGLLVCPESQMLHRGLFRILHRQGRVDELQDRIDRLDALLAEIGLEPEAKTVRLLEILLRVKTPESGPPV